jgi:hypothetical protein
MDYIDFTHNRSQTIWLTKSCSANTSMMLFTAGNVCVKMNLKAMASRSSVFIECCRCSRVLLSIIFKFF